MCMIQSTETLTSSSELDVLAYETILLQPQDAANCAVVGSASTGGSLWSPIAVDVMSDGLGSTGNDADVPANTLIKVDVRAVAKIKLPNLSGSVVFSINRVPFDSSLPVVGVYRAAQDDLTRMAANNLVDTSTVYATSAAGVTTSEQTGLTGVPGGFTTARRIVNGTGGTASIHVTWDLPTYPIQHWSGVRGLRLIVRPVNDSTGVPNTWATAVRRARLYVWLDSGYSAGVRSDQIVLASAGTVTPVDAGSGMLPGWQEISWDADDFRTDTGTPNDAMKISRIRVMFESVPDGFTADVAYIGPGSTTPGTFDLQFDDCRQSIYYYLPVLESYGVRASFGFVSGQFEDPVVASSLVSENANVYMSLAQCREAFSRGHYFLNHSRTHTNYGSATSGDVGTIQDDYEACADAINTYGLNRNDSALCVILPFGGWNQYVAEALETSTYGFKTAYRVGYQAVINGATRHMGPLGHQMRINPDETQVTLAETTAWLDRCLRRGTHVTWMGHEIGDYVTGSTITNTRATVRGILQHCREQGYVNLPGPEAVMVSRLYTQ